MSNESPLDNHHTRKNRLPLLLGALVAVFVITTIVLAVLFGIERNKSTSTSTAQVDNELCLTPYCVKAANYLLESIDETVEPCENFFEFACGTWLKNNRIPDDAGSQDTFGILRTELDKNVVDILTSPLPNDTTQIRAIANARQLYVSCANEAAIDSSGTGSILSIVNQELGGWPILLGSSWNESSFNITRLMINLRQYSHNLVYSFGTSTDDTNSSVYFIRIGQSDLGLEQRQYYVNESNNTIAYRQFIRELAEALSTNSSTIDTDVAAIYSFEAELAQFHWTAAEQNARQNESVRTTVGNLTRIFTTPFDFIQYLRAVYALSNVTLQDNDVVSVREIAFLRNASELLRRTPSRTIQNYIVWRFMMSRASIMPRNFRNIRDRFDRVFRGTSAERPRSIICSNYVNNNMGFAVAKVFIKKYFDENAKSQSLEMIENIRKAFIEMIRNSSWMDDASKSKAVEKATAIDEKIGYPEYLGSTDAQELEKIYADYVFTSSHADNSLKLLKIKSKENLRTLRELVDRRSWGASAPTVVNAFYTPSKNQITFPAGILQTPFFNKDAPKYLNYGGIGAVIGHEITHGFDDSGRQFDKDGNRIPWWSSGTIEKFVERKTCIVNQYSNYTVSQINMRMNGNQTQGENIADNGGVKEAFYAYQKWSRENGKSDLKLPGLKKYSPEQLFFVNYAQVWCSKMTNANAENRIRTGVHSPGQFRVLGPTSNFGEFDRVFNCKPGQGNSRVTKCAVW